MRSLMLVRDKDPSLRFGMTMGAVVGMTMGAVAGMTMGAVAGMTVVTNAGTTVKKVLQVT